MEIFLGLIIMEHTNQYRNPWLIWINDSTLTRLSRNKFAVKFAYL
jgi:hypothetical protein